MHISDWQATNTKSCFWHSPISDLLRGVPSGSSCLSFQWLKPPLSLCSENLSKCARRLAWFSRWPRNGAPSMCCHPLEQDKGWLSVSQWVEHTCSTALWNAWVLELRPWRAVGRSASDVSHFWKPWLSSCVRAALEESDQAWALNKGRSRPW